jgi:hypothetical protein
MIPAPLAKLEAMEQRMRAAFRENMAAASTQEKLARDALVQGDYSGAATACHRAHQARLRADLIRELLA